MSTRTFSLCLAALLLAGSGPALAAAEGAPSLDAQALSSIALHRLNPAWRSLVTPLHPSDRDMGPDPFTEILLVPSRRALRPFGVPVRDVGPLTGEPLVDPNQPRAPLHRRVRDTGPGGPPLG